MKNIIAFSGTHGTGKSSAAYKFTADLKLNTFNVIVIDEFARECPLPINKCANQDTQYWLICSQIKRELEVANKYDYIISDRSIFDSLAYGLVLNILDESLAYFIANYLNLKYKHILLLDPSSFNYSTNDGTRDLDPLFRLKVHERLLYLYNKYNIKYELILNHNQIKSYLNKIIGEKNNG
jgi:thymidylate kinase